MKTPVEMTPLPDYPAEAVARLRDCLFNGMNRFDWGIDRDKIKANDLAALLDYVEGMKWRPIESAPKDEDVMIYITDAAIGMEFDIAHCSSDDPDADWYSSLQDPAPAIDMPPTHWRPLPPPSRQEGVDGP